ncbi:MAG: hypothetical protein HYX54_09250 [Chloroflexi bacterium]|nr:hypothetical protein [Chloroflexota bacterium]
MPAERRAIIDLGPLSLDDGRRLAQSIDQELDGAVASDLWRRAGGSPFWIETLARGRASAEPSSVTIERLRDLSSDAGALLAVLAIGARPFDDDETAGILGWEAGRVVQASLELVSRGLALGVAGATLVAHDLIREAATVALPVPTKRRLHARLARCIEAAAGDDLSMLRESLDRHLAAGSPSTAIAMRLLSSPRRRLRGSDDLRLLGSISDGLDLGDPDQVRLDRSLGELAAVLGEQELAERRWAAVGENSMDPRDRQVAELEAARAAYRLGRPSTAHMHLGRAREAASSEVQSRLNSTRFRPKSSSGSTTRQPRAPEQPLADWPARDHWSPIQVAPIGSRPRAGGPTWRLSSSLVTRRSRRIVPMT